MQQFNPWPRKGGRRGGKGSGLERRNKERQALHPFIFLGADGGEGLPVAFTSLASHQRSCCSPYGIWPFLTNRPPIHSRTHIQEFTE